MTTVSSTSRTEAIELLEKQVDWSILVVSDHGFSMTLKPPRDEFRNRQSGINRSVDVLRKKGSIVEMYVKKYGQVVKLAEWAPVS